VRAIPPSQHQGPSADIPAHSAALVWLRRYRLPFDPADKLVLLMCLVYLPVWFAMGLVVEVRIFVPYLFLAAPTIARVWAAFLLDDKAAAHPPHSAA
jgi:hypothetical protein